MTNNYKCRACGSSNTECLGLLPKQTHWAGELIERNMPETNLYKCNACFMRARHPILSTLEYNQLYAEAGTTFWSNPDIQLRPDQVITRNIILKKFKDARKVLDIGCYTGDFLSSLPANYEKHGVEMSRRASSVSEERGINIIGNNLYDVTTTDKFDLIIAIDVIEHTHNPEEFLKKLAAMLEIGGGIIISTGNSDNWLWSNLKNRFWYSIFPEHISFIGVRWLEQISQKNNFIISEKHFFHYLPMNIKRFLKNPGKSFLALLRVDPERFSNSTKDHFCFVLKHKNNS